MMSLRVRSDWARRQRIAKVLFCDAGCYLQCESTLEVLGGLKDNVILQHNEDDET